jgi:hypothetical protein
MRKPKTKRISVTVDVTIPAEMTIGETDKWVEGCFPRSTNARCNEQRSAQGESCVVCGYVRCACPR